MIYRLLRRFPWQSTAQLCLLLMALISFVIGLGGMVRGAETSAFLPAAIPAVLLGWWLSQSRLKPWQALGGSGLLGAALLWGRTAQLGGPTLMMVVSLPGYLLQNFLYMHGAHRPGDPAALLQAIQSITSQSAAVWMRLADWLEALRVNGGVTSHDPVVRVLVWSLLLWLLAVWAGWAVGRNRVLAGLAPGLAALAAVTKYTNADVTALWLMTICTLGLMSVAYLGANLRRWSVSRLDYAEMITSNTMASALLLVLGLAALGWTVTTISVHDLLDAFRRHEGGENQVAVSLGLDAARQPAAQPTPSGFETMRAASLPNNHLLGSGPELSKDVFFTVRTGELSETPVAGLDQVAARHYWRSYSFDVYTGSGWVSSKAESLDYSPGQVLSEIPPGYHLLEQDFSLKHGDAGSLYWSGTLYSSNLPFKAAWRTSPGQNYPQAVDPFRGADLFGALNSAANYHVQSLVREVSVEQLRAAGRDTPDFIQQHYTELPSRVPERVYALARDLTSAAATPYDEALAIQNYLRTNYPYSLDVPLPPSGADVADTFLFELKRGYCDYYATAMVVMARSVGLPARLVMGFAPGAYHDLTAEYIVTAADAHSWVEIYFPGIGWVEFEPTAGQPEIVRPQKDAITAQTAPKTEVQWDKIIRSLYSMPPVARWVLLALGGLLGLVALFFVLEGWLLSLVSPRFALGWMLRSIYRQGRRLVGTPIPGQTTGEFAETLQQELSVRDVRLDVLTDIYLQDLFGPRALQKTQVQDAIRAWRGLRWNLLRTRKKKAVKPR